MLFVMATNPLFEKIKKVGAGVYLSGELISCLQFADDIAIFSCSIYGLKSLYDVIINFCKTYDDLMMNPSKSVIIRMGYKKREPENFYNIQTKPFSKYLGAYLTDYKNQNLEITRCAGSIYSKINEIIRHQPHLKYLPSSHKRQILAAFSKPYCLELIEDRKKLSKISRAHRMLTQFLWPNSRNLKA